MLQPTDSVTQEMLAAQALAERSRKKVTSSLGTTPEGNQKQRAEGPPAAHAPEQDSDYVEDQMLFDTGLESHIIDAIA